MKSTLYAYSSVSSRISSMNSYLLATGDPSRSTLSFFRKEFSISSSRLRRSSSLRRARSFTVSSASGAGSCCFWYFFTQPRSVSEFSSSSRATSEIVLLDLNAIWTASSRNSGEYLLGGATSSSFLVQDNPIGRPSGNFVAPQPPKRHGKIASRGCSLVLWMWNRRKSHLPSSEGIRVSMPKPWTGYCSVDRGLEDAVAHDPRGSPSQDISRNDVAQHLVRLQGLQTRKERRQLLKSCSNLTPMGRARSRRPIRWSWRGPGRNLGSRSSGAPAAPGNGGSEARSRRPAL